jgi:hypothetical protein
MAIGPYHFGRGLDRREEKIVCLEYLLHLRDTEGHVQLQDMVNALTQRNTTAVDFYHLLDSRSMQVQPSSRCWCETDVTSSIISSRCQT